MKDIAALISAIASLLWPVFAFFVLFIYRKQIGDLISRLRKGKLLGQEIELGESLDKLEESAVAAAQEVASLPAPAQEKGSDSIESNDSLVENILREAAKSPRAALLLLASELEREARHVLAAIGRLDGKRFVPLSQAIEVLQKQYGGLPSHIPNSLKLFWDLRGRLVHGGQADDEEILRAVDSGITILKALQAIPRETNYVYHPGVDIYHDEECRIPWGTGKGVILETESAGGTRRFFRIFPTLRTHFVKGKRVAWEWNHNTTWTDAWYKDPDSGEIRRAWNGAAEFIGRHLDEI